MATRRDDERYQQHDERQRDRRYARDYFRQGGERSGYGNRRSKG